MSKDGLVAVLRNSMGVKSVVVEGVDTPIEAVSAGHLGRIYREKLAAEAEEKRKQLAEQRRAERFLTTNDW